MAYARTFTSDTHGRRWLVLLVVAAAIAFFLMLSAAGAQETDPPTPTTPQNLAALRAVIAAHALRDSEAALTGWAGVTLPARTAEWKNIGRAAAYLDQEEFDLALAQLNTAVQINPQNAVAHYYLGVVYLYILDDRGVDVPLPSNVGGSNNGQPNATPYFTDSSYSATPYFVDKTNSATPYFTDSSYSATPYFVNRPTTPTTPTTTTLSSINRPVGSTIQNDSSVAVPTTDGSSLNGQDAVTTADDPSAAAVDLDDNDALLQAAAAELQLAVSLEPQLDRTETLLDVDPSTINETGGSPTVADLMQALGVTNFRRTALDLLAQLNVDQTAATSAALSTSQGTAASNGSTDEFDPVGASVEVMNQPSVAPVAYAVAFRRSLRADFEAFTGASR